MSSQSSSASYGTRRTDHLLDRLDRIHTPRGWESSSGGGIHTRELTELGSSISRQKEETGASPDGVDQLRVRECEVWEEREGEVGAAGTA